MKREKETRQNNCEKNDKVFGKNVVAVTGWVNEVDQSDRQMADRKFLTNSCVGIFGQTRRYWRVLFTMFHVVH